jgi:hypothetical protein
LNASLWNPVDATGLRLTVAARPSSTGGLELAIQIDPRDISFQPKGGRRNCALDVWLVQLDRQEKQLRANARTNNLSLDQSTFDKVKQVEGLALAEQLTPEPQAALLRVLVRDVSSGAIGTLTVPLRSLAPPAR